jgi:GNAT superfamily N-acetyltransferase
MLVPNYPWKVVQTPGLTIILFENFTQYRQIFTDGRDYPTERAPTWFGYSLGKWDGDTFVVDAVGFNDKAWLDDGGHPRSEAMHVTERWRRRDFGHLDIEFTFDDPKAYTKPWTVTIPFVLLPDTDIIENVCENEKDVEHIFFKK